MNIPIPAKDWLEQKYVTEDLTTRQIANLMDVSHETVRRWIKKRGIKTRPSHKRYFDMENHPGWKGGIKTGKGGYILIKKPDHPNADSEGYVKRSRLVVEQLIGRYLNRNELVHHINGIKTDDSPENLEVLSREAHAKKHFDSKKMLDARREAKTKCQ